MHIARLADRMNLWMKIVYYENSVEGTRQSARDRSSDEAGAARDQTDLSQCFFSQLGHARRIELQDPSLT
jgi:hypothetical protein